MTRYKHPLKFCWTCGKKIVEIKRHSHFDITTGNEVFLTDYKCPNDRWWKFSHSVEPRYRIIH